MKRLATLLFAAAAVLAVPAMAQDIGYSNSWPLTLPHDTFFGMAAGVATNSKGHVFVYTRNTDPIMVLGGSRAFAHGGSSLYEFGRAENSSARSASRSMASSPPSRCASTPTTISGSWTATATW